MSEVDDIIDFIETGDIITLIGLADGVIIKEGDILLYGEIIQIAYQIKWILNDMLLTIIDFNIIGIDIF